MHGKCVHRACKGWLSERGVVWRVREGESVKVIGLKVIGWLSEREGLRESSGDSSGESVKVIGWLASP